MNKNPYVTVAIIIVVTYLDVHYVLTVRSVMYQSVNENIYLLHLFLVLKKDGEHIRNLVELCIYKHVYYHTIIQLSCCNHTVIFNHLSLQVDVLQRGRKKSRY